MGIPLSLPEKAARWFGDLWPLEFRPRPSWVHEGMPLGRQQAAAISHGRPPAWGAEKSGKAAGVTRPPDAPAAPRLGAALGAERREGCSPRVTARPANGARGRGVPPRPWRRSPMASAQRVRGRGLGGGGGARARHPEVGGGGGGECAAGGPGGGFLALKGRPGTRGAGLRGAWVGRGRTGPQLPTLPVSLSRGVEWKSYGWVRRDQTDPDEALLERVYSDPRQIGKQGPLAGRAGLAAGKQRLAGPGAAWSPQGGWARASDSSEALSHGATTLWPVAGQPGDS